MRFTDRTLLRLVDGDEVAAMLTPAVGTALIRAAYTADHAEVGEATAVTVRAAALAPVTRPGRAVSGTAHDLLSSTQWQLAAELPPEPAVAGHAVLEVDVTAATRGAVSEVTAVATEDLSELADLGAVDARVAAADGVLPTDPEVLSRRRYEELSASVAERFTDTPADAVVAALRRRGLGDLDSLVRYLSEPARVSRLALTVVTDTSAPTVSRTYRMTVVVHVVESLTDGLLGALAALHLARVALAAAADPRPHPPGLTPREDLPGVLVLPAADLDDEDLPVAGTPPADPAARRAARLEALTVRLRGLAVVPVAV